MTINAGMAADALCAHRKHQAEDRLSAGALWRDNGLVFYTRIGTPLGAGNVRRSLRAITQAADIGERWTRRELVLEVQIAECALRLDAVYGG